MADLSEIDADVFVLENLQRDFLAANRHDAVEASIAGQIRAAKQKAGFSIDGEDFTPPDVNERLEEKSAWRMTASSVKRRRSCGR
jgi:hypothetical protein